MSVVAARVAAACERAGLDLSALCRVGAYNREIPPPFQLPDAGDPERAVLVIGNTRALWPHFIAYLRADPERIDRPHPLQDYVERAVNAAVADEPAALETRFTHEPPPRRFSAQRLAHVAGLAYLGASHLCVHPTVGPWLALRAAIVLDETGPAQMSVPLSHPCGDCTRQCEPLLHRAVAGGPDGPWTAWLAMRDACPVGRAYRYGDDQIHYHYLKDREVLRRAVAEQAP